MKKLIFTAFAVVMLSTVSKANTITRTEENIKEDGIFYQDCNVWAMNFCEEMNGWNDSNSINSYNTYRTMVEFCEGFQMQYVEAIDSGFIEIEGGRIEPLLP